MHIANILFFFVTQFKLLKVYRATPRQTEIIYNVMRTLLCNLLSFELQWERENGKKTMGPINHTFR